jgi:indole-3-glycerol phosphate synthase
VASTPCDAPAPLTPEQLSLVPGVLGAIARERAADYADEAGPAPASAGRAGAGRFRGALTGPGIALIAEVKRASPSRGAIADLDPVASAEAYRAGGAAAVSVLTEPRHFGGARAHLRAVAAAVDAPVLRKDFVVHPRQLGEARDDGASAVLLIVAVLGDALPGYLAYARALGLDALVEVHDEDELAAACAAGADLIGVNNRDLTTLAIDLATAPRLIAFGRRRAADTVWIAESGYREPQGVAALTGFADAVLVGTHLAAQADPGAALRRLVGAP